MRLFRAVVRHAPWRSLEAKDAHALLRAPEPEPRWVPAEDPAPRPSHYRSPPANEPRRPAEDDEDASGEIERYSHSPRSSRSSTNRHDGQALKAPSKLHAVFVYGTLRRGEHNNFLLEGQKFIGEAISACAHFSMRAQGIPYVRHDIDGRGKHVRGELYLVDDRCLKELDLLEGHPRFYCRRKRSFKVGSTYYAAWIYLCPGRGQDIAPTGSPPALEAPRFRGN